MTLYRHNAKGRIEKIPRVELAVFWLVMVMPWIGLGYKILNNSDRYVIPAESGVDRPQYSAGPGESSRSVGVTAQSAKASGLSEITLAATPMSSSTDGRTTKLVSQREASSTGPVSQAGEGELLSPRATCSATGGEPVFKAHSRYQARPAQPFAFGPGSKYDRHNEQLKQAGN